MRWAIAVGYVFSLGSAARNDAASPWIFVESARWTLFSSTFRLTTWRVFSESDRERSVRFQPS